jgi:translation elongation factor P/translation initiation factor 5A
MKKKASELKKGDKIAIGSETLEIESLEVSGLGKQGTQKCRIVAKRPNGEKLVIIRPADYPFYCL